MTGFRRVLLCIKSVVLLGFLLMPAMAMAQGWAIQGQAVDPTGRPLAFAKIRVCAYTASGAPCSPLTSLWSDIPQTHAISNPYTTDNLGNYTFVVASLQSYIVQVYNGSNIAFVYLYTAGSTSSGGGGTPCVTSAGALQYNNNGNFGCAPADYNHTFSGEFAFLSPTFNSIVDPSYIPALTFGGNNQYAAGVDYFTQSLLTNDSGNAAGLSGSIRTLNAQYFYPGWDYGETVSYEENGLVINQYDYTDGLRCALCLNLKQYGGDDTNWFDIQTYEANVQMFASGQGSAFEDFQRQEQGYDQGTYTNTIATGGGGLGQTTLTNTGSGCCSFTPVGLHRPAIDTTAGVISTTLSSILTLGLGNGISVNSAVSSATLTPSVQGALASAITVGRITNNATMKLPQTVVTFNVTIATPPTANSTLCTIVGSNGPGVDWIKPTAVTLVSTGVYAFTAPVLYSHPSGSTVFCGGTMGFLGEPQYEYTWASSDQHRYLFEIYGVTSAGLLVYGIQTPEGPQQGFGQTGTIPAHIYQGGEIVGSLNPTTGLPDGGKIVIYPNNAVWANGDTVEVDNFMNAFYSDTFIIDNIDDPFASVNGDTRIRNSTGGILNPQSTEYQTVNNLGGNFYKTYGGYGYARPAMEWVGLFGGGTNNFSNWPIDDGGNIPNVACGRGVLAGCAGLFDSGTIYGTGKVFSFPGGLVTFTNTSGQPPVFDFGPGSGMVVQTGGGFAIGKNIASYLGFVGTIAAFGSAFDGSGNINDADLSPVAMSETYYSGGLGVCFTQTSSFATCNSSITNPSTGTINLTTATAAQLEGNGSEICTMSTGCGGGGGSGYFTGTPTVAVTGTFAAGQFLVATSSTAAVPDTLLTDNGTTLSYAGTGGVSTVGSSGVGGTWTATEGTGPSATSGVDILYADATSHCLKYSANGGSFGCIGTSSGGDTITSPNSTLAVGGSSSATTLDLLGAAGKIMAGATPALTYTPTLGVDGASAGTVQLANNAASAHTIFGSKATTSNTVDFFAAAPTNLDLIYCATSSTTCTLTDAGYPYNAIPSTDIAGLPCNATVAQPTPFSTTGLQAFSNAANTVVNVTGIGDSFLVVSIGLGNSGPASGHRYMDLLRNYFAGCPQYGGNTGTGMYPVIYGFSSGLTYINTDAWSSTGSPDTSNSSLGPTQTGAGLNGNTLVHLPAGSSLIFNDNRNIPYTAGSVYYATPTGTSSLVVSEGGTTLATVTSSNSTVAGVTCSGLTARRYDITGLASGTHTITFSNGSGDAYVFAWQGEQGTTGVRIHNLGVGGAIAAAFGSNAACENAFSDLIPGGVTEAFIMDQTNDATSSISPSTFQTNMTNWVNHQRSLASAPTVALAIPPVDVGDNTTTMAPFTAVQMSMCITLQLTCQNIQQRWALVGSTPMGWGPTYNAASGLWDTTHTAPGVHPNTAGSADEFQQIAAMILNPTGFPKPASIYITVASGAVSATCSSNSVVTAPMPNLNATNATSESPFGFDTSSVSGWANGDVYFSYVPEAVGTFGYRICTTNPSGETLGSNTSWIVSAQ